MCWLTSFDCNVDITHSTRCCLRGVAAQWRKGCIMRSRAPVVQAVMSSACFTLPGVISSAQISSSHQPDPTHAMCKAGGVADGSLRRIEVTRCVVSCAAASRAGASCRAASGGCSGLKMAGTTIEPLQQHATGCAWHAMLAREAARVLDHACDHYAVELCHQHWRIAGQCGVAIPGCCHHP